MNRFTRSRLLRAHVARSSLSRSPGQIGAALLFLFGFFFCAVLPRFATLRAQEITQYRYTAWKTEQGLPQNSVKAILQTRDGYLWFSTRFGIVRFDGVRFQIFDRVNTPSMGDDNGTAFVQEENGTLWFATPKGVTSYKQRQFTHHRMSTRGESNRVWSISVRREGGIWIGTSDGLKALHNGQFSRYSMSDGLKTNVVKSVLEDRDGSLWVGTEKGLHRLNPSTRKFDHLPDSPAARVDVRYLHQDRQGAIWVGTTAGLHRWRVGQWTSFTTRNGLSDNQIDFITEDRRGNVWITTARGDLLRLRDGKFTRFGRNEGLSDDWVLCLSEDLEGNLWVGTHFGGLNRMQPRNIAAYSVKDGLIHNNAWSICPSADGGIWIGTDGGVSRFRNGKFSSYTFAPETGDNRIKSVLEDHTGTLWAGTRAGGVKTMRNGRPTRSYSVKEGLAHDQINAIYEDRESRIWIGTLAGLNCLVKGQITTYTSKDGLAHDDIRGILQDRKGALWVATYGGGVNCFRDGQFTAFTTKEGLSDNSAWVIYEDKDADGALWIGTESGLNRLKDGHIRVFTMNEGLFDNVVNGILEDDHGNLWISCNRGIYRVRKEELNAVAEGKLSRASHVSYGASDGMLSSETNGENQPAACKTPDDKLWFPTTEGIVVIEPGAIADNDLAPPVVIEDVVMDDQSLDPNLLAPLPPGRGNVIEFRYTANSLVAPEKVRFMYCLDGCDEDWTDAGDRRVAYYTNLRPGHYTFRVKASNNHGVWNQTGASFAFYLAPHFYQTWPFYVLCGIFTVLTGYGLHRVRLGVVRKIERLEKQHALEKERTRIANEMHDDLGSSLTQIALLSELANRDLEHTNRASEHIRKITGTAREVFRAMDEIVWAVNPKHDTLSSLIGYVSKFAQDFLRPAGIRCRLDLPEQMPAHPLSTDERHNLFLAVKEALNNIVKHASASEVWLRVAVNKSTCFITIEDNGLGFAVETARPDGNGLGSMRERLATIGGEFRVESLPGRGTKLQLTVNLGQSRQSLWN